MVRQLNKDDLGDFFRLRLEGLKAVPSAFLASYEEESAKGPGFFESILSSNTDHNVIFGAFDGDSLVGAIGVFSDSHAKSRHKATIWGMYVRADVRGRGFGTALVQRAIDHAKSSMGARTVYLSVESTNELAKSLYKKCGFTTWGQEPESLFVNGVYYNEDYMFLHTRDWKAL